MLWPALAYAEWKETRNTLHMQLQVIGKVRLELSPFEPQCASTTRSSSPGPQSRVSLNTSSVDRPHAATT